MKLVSYLHFDTNPVLLFCDRSLSAEMISTFSVKQRLHLLFAFRKKELHAGFEPTMVAPGKNESHGW